MTYCCSDLHGCFDEFIALLKKINFTNSDTMYVIGDTIDRGPKPIELLKYIYGHDNVIPLMGNHESFLLDYIDSGFDCSDTYDWDINDGEITRLAFDKLRKKDPVLCKNISDYIKTWDLCLVLEPFILSHAGYNAAILKDLPPGIESLNKMTQDDLLWSREDFFEHKGIDGYITIFGHTPVRSIRSGLNQNPSDDVWVCPRYQDKIGIDGAIAHGGQLNCVNLDAMEFVVVHR